MSDESKKVWLGLGAWIIQRSVIVIVVAGALWIQVHYTSKSDFDTYKLEQLTEQKELNKTLTQIALSLKEITDNHAHDAKTMEDHEDRLRKLEGRGK